jgi:O-methyltransferase domain/Dimerisation domain
MTTHQPSGIDTLRRLIIGYRLSQALHVAAVLGIADLLKDGPRHFDDLARSTKSHASSLYRLLRLLASVGVFTEQDEGRFALTPLAEPLRSDVPDSLRARAMFDGAQGNWGAWGNLFMSIKTGDPAIKHTFGKDLFGYLNDHPHEATIFNEVMAAQTSAATRAILDAYDFSEIGKLVDIGGGVGALLAAILNAYPSMRGVLYDQAHVAVDAKSRLAAAGVADRCETVGGDFFESVPTGANAYILKHILHDWDEEDCRRIIENCRSAITKDGRLLAIEVLNPPGDEPHYGKFVDLQMLVVTKGGRERTEAEYRHLFASAGFTLSRVVPTKSDVCLIEGRPC